MNDDLDATLPVPKPTAAVPGAMTDEAARALFEVAAPAFSTQPTSPSGGWQPPSVEDLQQSLPQYEITQFIARGGMGAVYRGMQRSLKRPVAIKVLPPDMIDGDLQFAARFKQEAQSMARLSHPNIVAVFDAGETAGGLLYFVMEFIEGTDVAQLIASEGRLEPLRAIQITTAVCEALAFAHEEGIIHRDIKPSNIMIDRRGRVKVADFGLAKSVHLDSTLLTGSNVAMGTPDFIAPEAMIPGIKLDQRADLYAVGVMLYQMLTGHIPRGRFELPSGVVPQVDKGFDTVVDKAMQTDRDKRYSTAIEMKTDVERVGSTPDGREAPPPGVATRGAPQAPARGASLKNPPARKEPPVPRKSNKVRDLVIVAVLLVVVGAGAFFATRRPQPGTAAGTPVDSKSAPSSQASNPAGTAAPPSSQWVALDFASTPKNENVSLEGSQLHVTGGWRPLGSKRLRHAAQRISFIWRENTSNVKLSTGDTSDAVHYAKLGNSRSGGQYWEIGHYTGRDESLKGSGTDIDPPLKPGDSVVFQFATIGDRHFAWLNGRLLGSVSHPVAAEGGLLSMSPYELLLDRYEYIDLDGLPEVEALKAVGVDAAATATAVAPDPVRGADGRMRFPVGVWTRMRDREKDASTIAKHSDDPGFKQDGPWMRCGIAYGWYDHEVIFMTNLGIRARFRGQRVKDSVYPQLNLCGNVSNTNQGLNLCINSGKVEIRTTETGFPVLASAPLREPLPAGKEYDMELYAIGARVFARVNGQLLTTTTKLPPEPGHFAIYGADMDYFRDAQVLNLDGLPEAEALKAVGVGGMGGDVPAKTRATEISGAVDRHLFDGKSLSGWHGLGNQPVPSTWHVTEGVMIGGPMTGGSGTCLVSDEEFGDFDLSLDWRVKTGGNGGIVFLISAQENGGQFDIKWPEFNLMDDALASTNRSGSLFGAQETTSTTAVKPVGDWNTARLVNRGGKVEHWINDQLVCAYDLNDPAARERWKGTKTGGQPGFAAGKRGRIGLQGWNGEISYRNVVLHGASASASPWQREDFATMDAADLSNGKTYSVKEGDTLHLNHDEIRAAPGPAVHNGAIRATVRWGAKTFMPRLVTRMDKKKQYAAYLSPTGIGLNFYDGADHLLQGFTAPAPFKAGDTVVFQLASIGTRHFLWVDGRLAGTVEDANHAGPGTLGIQANDAHYESMEWLTLDGLSETEAMKVLGIEEK